MPGGCFPSISAVRQMVSTCCENRLPDLLPLRAERGHNTSTPGAGPVFRARAVQPDRGSLRLPALGDNHSGLSGRPSAIGLSRWRHRDRPPDPGLPTRVSQRRSTNSPGIRPYAYRRAPGPPGGFSERRLPRTRSRHVPSVNSPTPGPVLAADARLPPSRMSRLRPALPVPGRRVAVWSTLDFKPPAPSGAGAPCLDRSSPGREPEGASRVFPTSWNRRLPWACSTH